MFLSSGARPCPLPSVHLVNRRQGRPDYHHHVRRYTHHVQYRGPYWGAVRAAQGRAVSRNIDGPCVCAYSIVDATVTAARLIWYRCTITGVARINYREPRD